MVTKTKKAGKALQQKTSFVMVTPEVQVINQEVQKAYQKIINAAQQLLTKFELSKFRTYIIVENTKDPQNTNYINEFICHFWSINLINGRDGRYYIYINYDSDYIEKFGSNLTNLLLREAYRATNSEDGTNGCEYALKVMFTDHDVHNYFFRLTFEGETDTVSIAVVERPEVA